MKNIVLSMVSLTLIITAVAQPAEAASRKTKPLVTLSDRLRDSFAAAGPSMVTSRPALNSAPDIERLRNEALSAPAGR